MVPLTLKIV